MTSPLDRRRFVAAAEARELIARCRRGDEDAARVLVRGYFDRLLPLARGRLSRRLAGRLDAEDVVQSVFCSFFSQLKNGWFQPASHDDLYRLLVRMTVCRTLKQVTYHHAAKRDPRQELAPDRNDRPAYLDLPGYDPAPDAAAMSRDQLDHFLGRLPQRGRQVLSLRLQGYTTAEIARKLNTYDRMVRRVVERIRDVARLEGLSV